MYNRIELILERKTPGYIGITSIISGTNKTLLRYAPHLSDDMYPQNLMWVELGLPSLELLVYVSTLFFQIRRRLFHQQLHLQQDQQVIRLQGLLRQAMQDCQTKHLKQLQLHNHLDYQLMKHVFHLIGQQVL